MGTLILASLLEDLDCITFRVQMRAKTWVGVDPLLDG